MQFEDKFRGRGRKIVTHKLPSRVFLMKLLISYPHFLVSLLRINTLISTTYLSLLLLLFVALFPERLVVSVRWIVSLQNTLLICVFQNFQWHHQWVRLLIRFDVIIRRKTIQFNSLREAKKVPSAETHLFISGKHMSSGYLSRIRRREKWGTSSHYNLRRICVKGSINKLKLTKEKKVNHQTSAKNLSI